MKFVNSWGFFASGMCYREHGAGSDAQIFYSIRLFTTKIPIHIGGNIEAWLNVLGNSQELAPKDELDSYCFAPIPG